MLVTRHLHVTQRGEEMCDRIKHLGALQRLITSYTTGNEDTSIRHQGCGMARSVLIHRPGKRRPGFGAGVVGLVDIEKSAFQGRASDNQDTPIGEEERAVIETVVKHVSTSGKDFRSGIENIHLSVGTGAGETSGD